MILVLALAAPIYSAQMNPQEMQPAGETLTAGLVRHESVHFTLYADFNDPAYTQKLLGDLEKSFSHLQKEFWDFIPVEHREGHVEAIVFADAASFEEFSGRDAGMPHGTKGYLNARSRRMAILRQDRYYKDLMIAVHELAHVFNAMCTPHTPVWLDEGMAQFYANRAAGQTGGANVKNGVNPASLAVIDGALEAGRFPHISALLGMGDEEFYGAASRENFAAAWALVLYLRRGLGGSSDQRFARYYSVIARGGDDYRAFTGTYGSNMKVLEDLWLLYLEKLYRQTAALLDEQGDRSADDGAAQPDEAGQDPAGQDPAGPDLKNSGRQDERAP